MYTVYIQINQKVGKKEAKRQKREKIASGFPPQDSRLGIPASKFLPQVGFLLQDSL